MSSVMNIILVIALFGSVIGINRETVDLFKNVCQMRDKVFYSSLNEILEKEVSYQESHHSFGFHLTKELCHRIEMRTSPMMPPSLTAYYSSDTIIVFIQSEVNVDNSMATLKFGAISELTSKHLSKSFKSFTVVWIKSRSPQLESPTIYNISYLNTDGKQESTRTQNWDRLESLRNEEQILLTDIDIKEEITEQYLNITPIGTEVTNSYSVSDSYMILCLVNDNKKSTNCKPIYIGDNEKGISCECDVRYQLTTIIIMILFWLSMVFIATKPLMDMILDKGDKEKTDFMVAVSVNPKRSIYDYVIGIRLAKATPDFDLKDVNIDIEFFGEKENVAPLFRFKAIVLERQALTQIRILMLRLTKLPELKRVQVNHSGRDDGKITIFGVFVYCRKGDEDIRVYKVNKNIVKESRSLRLVKGDERDLESDEEALKTLNNFKLSLSFLELIWILFVDITVIAFTAAVINNTFGNYSVMMKMLIRVVITSLLVIIFNYVFIKAYNWIRFADLREQSKMNSNYEKAFFIGIRVYIIISILISIGLGLFVGFSNISQKNIETFQWFCVTFCATTVFIFFWTVGHHITLPKRSKPPSEISEDNTGSSVESLSKSQLGSKEA